MWKESSIASGALTLRRTSGHNATSNKLLPKTGTTGKTPERRGRGSRDGSAKSSTAQMLSSLASMVTRRDLKRDILDAESGGGGSGRGDFSFDRGDFSFGRRGFHGGSGGFQGNAKAHYEALGVRGLDLPRYF
jgi:hypothetical protein